MNESTQGGKTTRFVLIAVKRDAAYWTPQTIAREIQLQQMLDSPSEAALGAFRDEVVQGLVGRQAEKFWASDAVTASNAAAIRSACQALHNLTIEVLAQTAAELNPKPPTEAAAKQTRRKNRPNA
jgi:hypothetical protein